jgi:uncharacterized membrane protein YccC
LGTTDFLLRWIGTSLGILAAATLVYVVYRRLRRALRHWRARMRHRRSPRREASEAQAPQSAPPSEAVNAPGDSEC